MKFYVSRQTLAAIKKGMPMCDVYLPRHATGERKYAIDIEQVFSCESCDAEGVESAMFEHDDVGYFCEKCTKIHGY